MLKNTKKTINYPKGQIPALPDRFTGIPRINAKFCKDCTGPCIENCPTHALFRTTSGEISMDMGMCLFCRDCSNICPHNAIVFTSDHQLATTERNSLVRDTSKTTIPPVISPFRNSRWGKYLKKSCSIRVVSTGGCGACEADTNVLTTLAWDLGRFGIHFVASPRHADGLIIIGPQTQNMDEAVRMTYQAIPDPKFCIALGTCGISGGLYAENSECLATKESAIPIDLYIPGCPPHPLTILDALLRFLGIPVPEL